jgi:MFS family permease
LPTLLDEFYLGGPDANISDSKIAVYSGMLGCSYSFAQFFSNFPLGLASDRYGRKPFMLLGTFAILINNLAFVFIESYGLAICARLFCGFLVANNSIVRSYLTETTDETNRTQGFTVVNVAHVLGMITGPVIGGFLSRPAENLPGFDSAFFKTHVYSLPFVSLTVLSFIIFALILFCLPESQRLEKKDEPLL